MLPGRAGRRLRQAGNGSHLLSKLLIRSDKRGLMPASCRWPHERAGGRCDWRHIRPQRHNDQPKASHPRKWLQTHVVRSLPGAAATRVAHGALGSARISAAVLQGRPRRKTPQNTVIVTIEHPTSISDSSVLVGTHSRESLVP